MRRARMDDGAVAGVVAGILMLGAIVAFLAYMNVAWVPTWMANKEAIHATEVGEAMTSWGAAAEDHAQRNLVQRSFSRAIPMGVRGIPILGTGSSSGELTLETDPSMTLSLGGSTIFQASGSLVAKTHTLHYPNQTYRYQLGAVEINQSDGAWVDVRSFVYAQRTTSNQVNLTVQAISVTGAAGQGSGVIGQAVATGTLVTSTNSTYGAGNVRIQLTGVSGDAWRASLQRTFNASALTLQNAADCTALTNVHYCFDTDTNTATAVDLYVLNVASGWSATHGVVSVQVRT